MADWRQNIRRVEPYVPGEQPDQKNMVKLNTNENPYPPSPAVQEALSKLDAGALKLYPDPAVTQLVEALAKYHNLENDQVFVGVGSDDVLAMAFLTFFNSGRPILFPEITYSFYKVWADLYRIPYELTAVDEDLAIRFEDFKRPNGGVVVPNPNAPTAIYAPLSVIEELIASNPEVVVIIDEAYIDFAGPSALTLLPKYDNLLVVRTFSKSRSMAGMRIGYAMGNTELIKALNDVKYAYNSYTMSRPAILAGTESVKDQVYFERILEKIVNTRETAKEKLAAMGFHCTDSQTNFLFVTHPRVNAKDLFEALKVQDIYVRYFAGGRTKKYLRITVGTDAEMKKLYDFLEEYLNEA